MSNKVFRYSDAELEAFRQLIENKLEKAKGQLQALQEQILEIAENTSDEHGGDWMDDSSTNNDMEMLNNMAIRQRRFIQNLENALIRIRNKVYGVCTVTGELIDKKRLLAVPTTTKSLAAKTQAPASRRSARTQVDEEDSPRKKPARPKEKKVISRIIRKSGGIAKPAKAFDLDEIEDGEYPMDNLELDDDMISFHELDDDGEDNTTREEEDD